MGNIVLLTCGLMFVAASMKEEATQLLRPIAKPGYIEEPLITERLITESGNIKQGSHFCTLSYYDIKKLFICNHAFIYQISALHEIYIEFYLTFGTSFMAVQMLTNKWSCL